METTRNWLSEMIHFGIALPILAGSLSACSNTTHYKEEVRLSDGRVMVVERETLYTSGGDEWAFNRSGTKPKEYRLRFTYPPGSEKTVEWHTIKWGPDTWPENPLMFDFETDKPIVFATVAVSIGCEIYTKYRYENGNWVEEALPEHFDQREANLLIREDVELPKFVSFAFKQEVHSDSRTQNRYLKIGPSRRFCG